MFRIAKSALRFFTLPEAAQIKTANVPDLSDLRRESEGWACGLGVATAFGGKFSDARHWQLLFNFVRRVEGAIDQFETGRCSLLSVPDESELATSRYLLAVMHFESCVAQTLPGTHAHLRVRKARAALQTWRWHDLSAPQSVIQQIKARRESYRRRPTSGRHVSPVTVTADALVSTDARVDFVELAETLQMLGRGAGDAVGVTFFGGGDKTGEPQDESHSAERRTKIDEDW